MAKLWLKNNKLLGCDGKLMGGNECGCVSACFHQARNCSDSARDLVDWWLPCGDVAYDKIYRPTSGALSGAHLFFDPLDAEGASTPGSMTAYTLDVRPGASDFCRCRLGVPQRPVLRVVFEDVPCCVGCRRTFNTSGPISWRQWLVTGSDRLNFVVDVPWVEPPAPAVGAEYYAEIATDHMVYYWEQIYYDTCLPTDLDLWGNGPLVFPGKLMLYFSLKSPWRMYARLEGNNRDIQGFTALDVGIGISGWCDAPFGSRDCVTLAYDQGSIRILPL